MPFVDTSKLGVIERLPGWHGRYFHSASMTFAHYDFVRGSTIHEHFHPQEEVYEVIEGELELTIDGVTQIARPGMVGIVPSNVRHSVKALTDGRAIIVDYPLRREFEQQPDFGNLLRAGRWDGVLGLKPQRFRSLCIAAKAATQRGFQLFPPSSWEGSSAEAN